MRWHVILYLTIITATIIAFVILALYSFRKRTVVGSFAFAWFSVLGAWGGFAEAMSFLSTTPEAAHAWFNARFVTIAFLPVMWGIFTIQYSGRLHWLSRSRLLPLFLVPVVTQIMIWTNGHHGLWLRKEAGIVLVGHFMLVDTAVRELGPWFWVQAGYGFSLLFLGVVLTAIMSIGLIRIYRRQAIAIGLGTIFLIVGSVIATFNLFHCIQFNPMIEVLALSGIIFAWAIFRYRFLDLVPVARERLIESIDNAVIVLDARNMVIDLNPAMLRLLQEGYASAGLTLSSGVIGQPAGALFSPWQELGRDFKALTEFAGEISVRAGTAEYFFDLRISPLLDRHGRKTGRIIVLHDITDLKNAEIALRDKTRSLGERMKELKCLYGVSEIIRRQGIALDDIMRETAAIIPPAFQYPEIACARVTLNAREFTTTGFRESQTSLAANIVVNDVTRGRLEVFYCESGGMHGTGMFLPEERDLVDAIAERLGRVIERRWAENDLRLSEARLDALYKMNNRDFASEKELIEYAMEEEVRLTGSEIGYFHFVREDGVSLELFVWSSRVMETCTVSPERHYPLDRAGVWADCVRTRRPAVHNDFAGLPDKKGFPEGHSPIIRHASVPIFDGDRIVAVSGVANKPGPYNGQDIRQMELFMNGIWRILMRRRSDEALARILSEKDALLAKLEASEAELRDRNAKMEFDLMIAQSAQRGFVRDFKTHSDLLAVEYRYQPMEKVGGDYFSFFEKEDGAIAFFIGDVSGHGVAAALFIALLKSITDRAFRDTAMAPDVYLRTVNDELVDYISSNFVTAIYGIFVPGPESGTVTLRYSNGAHIKPVIMKPDGACSFHGVGNMLIGVTREIAFDVNEITLSRGDRFFVLTDGIPEAMNKNNEMIGFEDGLLGLFRRCRRDSVAAVLDAMIDETARFRGDASQQDDITLIGFEVL